MSRKLVQELVRAKIKAQEAGNLKEEARVCGELGDQYTEEGRHEDALRERRCELALNEAAGDRLEVAKAHRMIGETLCSLEDYENALNHQQQHLQISKQLDSLVEQQRALATIGRTLFVWSEQKSDQAKQQHLTESLKVYLGSLELCDCLEDDVGKGELLEMKGRLFLNIGLVYEAQGDMQQAEHFLEQACHILKENKSDTFISCCLSLGMVRNAQQKFEMALDSYRTALQVAKQLGSKEYQLEAVESLGTTYAQLEWFLEGKKVLRQGYRDGRNDPSCNVTNIRRQLMRVTKLLRLQEQVKSEEDTTELIKMYDKMGDVCHSLQAHQAAILYYQQELKLVERCCGDVKPVLVSLAMTYADIGDHGTALNYYEQELSHCHGNHQEESVTWTAIARLRSDAGHDHKTVMTAYQRALSLAKMAENEKQEFLVYQQICSYCDNHGYHDSAKHTRREMEKLHHVEASINTDSDSDDDSDTSEVSLSSSEEGDMVRRNQRRTTRVDRRNEKGETPLHVAAIAGNVKLVRQLIEKGAHVNTRDHCGWSPLHEACNHGHTEVVGVLLEHGAAVNDPGGVHCDGITPLHDAAVNGQVEVVQMLLDYGADVSIVDKKGRTALDIAMERYDSHGDDYEGVVSLLRAAGGAQLKKSQTKRSDASSGEALVTMPTSPSNNNNEEWLVNDMPTTRKKRKTSHEFESVSRKRSCDATSDDGDFPIYTDDFLFDDEGTFPSELDTMECFDNDVSNPVQSDVVVATGNHNTTTVATGNQLNFIRAMVKVENHTFLVPCDPSSTIGWLCSVAAERYAALDGRQPQLSLTNQKGALLANEDLVAAVINNEECVDAHVISWTTLPLVDIYCNTSSGDVNNRVVQKLKSVSNLSHKVELSNCSIRGSQLTTIVKCLTHQSSLTTLCLRGNRLSCSLDGLSSLPSLTMLDLSACGLSHVHLTPGCVGQLRHLSLGHNTFGGDRGVALAMYLTWCTALEHLSLIDCSLDHMTSLSLWQSIAKMKYLCHLDISYNILNEALGHIPISSCLGCINLTSVVSHDPLPVVSLLESKLQYHLHLQQLVVQSCCLRDAHMIRLADTLQSIKSLTTLDLTNNNITMETINFIKSNINHTSNIIT